MKHKLNSAVASVLGVGFLPMAPGTWASLLGIGIWYAAQQLANFGVIQWLMVSACIIVALYSIEVVRKKWGEDPSQVVIDELAGVWVACLLLPHHVAVLFTAFIFFRLFDIWKPLGIRKLEAIPGAAGVLLDDILAGVYANLCVQGLLLAGVWKI